jgi:CIC family chloride channel protein
VLLISSSFGMALGALLNNILPGTDVALGAFAIVAMAATFGAATRATFTSIVFVFELTRDYDVILPLMLATVIADLVFSAVNEDSLMTEKLRRRGLRIRRHYGIDPFSTATIAEIMTTDVRTLPADATLGQARACFVSPAVGAAHGAYPIVDDDRLVGIVSRGDLLRHDSSDDEPLLDHASADVVVVAPDDLASRALQVMVEKHRARPRRRRRATRRDLHPHRPPQGATARARPGANPAAPAGARRPCAAGVIDEES